MIELSYFSNHLDMLLKVLFETRNLVDSHYLVINNEAL